MKPDWVSHDGTVELWCGDCLDVVPTLSGVDAMIVDPPYGIAHKSSHGASWQDTCIAGDESTEVRDAVLGWARSNGLPWACFGTWKVSQPIEARGVLVWDKGLASGMGDLSFPWKPSWETIAIGGQGWSGQRDEGILRGYRQITWESMGRQHPHEKPPSLSAALLAKLPNAKTILDPCMGTNPTGVACVKLGRKFRGVEVDRRYFDIAVRRVEQAYASEGLWTGALEKG